jgi:hypothetical protein
MAGSGPKYGNKQGQLVHGPAVSDAAQAAGAAPTKAEYDALVAKFNALLAACRSANIVG